MNKTKQQKTKEDNTMTGTALKMNNDIFNQFLNANREKINSIVPKNPSISKSDEWRNENFWDEDEQESRN